MGGQDIKVLKGINLTVNRGEFAIIFGPSGCGKSTLLHTILGMEAPTEGKVWFDGEDFYAFKEDDKVRYRKDRIGVVFQQPIWIKSLNVIENVSFPMRLMGKTEAEALAAAEEKMKIVKLEQWGHHHPNELSSGQQQRVSLARALTLDPPLLVADEPTGNLDTVSGDELMEFLAKLCQERNKTILMVTHDLEYLKYATVLFHIVDGELVETGRGSDITNMARGIRTKKGERVKTTVEDKDYLKTRGKQ